MAEEPRDFRHDILDRWLDQVVNTAHPDRVGAVLGEERDLRSAITAAAVLSDPLSDEDIAEGVRAYLGLAPGTWAALHSSMRENYLRLHGGRVRRILDAVRTAAERCWWNEAAARVDGDVPCPVCGLQWRQHEQAAKRDVPTLVRGCDGGLRKL